MTAGAWGSRAAGLICLQAGCGRGGGGGAGPTCRGGGRAGGCGRRGWSWWRRTAAKARRRRRSRSPAGPGRSATSRTSGPDNPARPPQAAGRPVGRPAGRPLVRWAGWPRRGGSFGEGAASARRRSAIGGLNVQRAGPFYLYGRISVAYLYGKTSVVARSADIAAICRCYVGAASIFAVPCDTLAEPRAVCDLPYSATSTSP